MRSSIIWFAAACGLAALLGTQIESAPAAETQQPGVLDKIGKALPAKAPATPKAKRKVLIFSKTAGFRHKSIDTGKRAIAMLGEKTGAFLTLATEDESIFEPARLKEFDAVLMLNTTNDCFRPKEAGKTGPVNAREEMLKKSLLDFVKSGKGLMGIHAATDTYHNWKDYNVMMGGTFIQHPWTENSKVVIKNLEPNHPINAAFGGKGFDITDEIYVFKPGTALPSERRFLLSLDASKMDFNKVKFNQGAKREDNVYPISWIANFGKGRNFYCSLGHRDDIYWNPAVLAHYLAGFQFALGDLEADASPTAPKK